MLIVQGLIGKPDSGRNDLELRFHHFPNELDLTWRADHTVDAAILGEQSDEHLKEVLRGDYKSQLQQFTQAQLRLTPTYRLVGTSGPEHSKQFHVEVLVGERVLAGGVGRNKQIAEQAAAQQALLMLAEEIDRDA